MRPSPGRGVAAALLAAVVVTATAACRTGATGATAGSAPAPATGDRAAIEKARADSARYPYTEADIHFMSAMIGHHAQAIEMSRMAPTHGASASVRNLAERIINAQSDEIRTMQTWLRDRSQPVPDPTAAGGMAAMHGAMMHGQMAHGADAGHPMLMPGMLTPEQMKQLDAARGPDFDRLFLQFMIQHHRGAVLMVQQLFGSYGAAQDEIVFKFANDVNVDQTTEIARMERMLAAQLFGGSSSSGP